LLRFLSPPRREEREGKGKKGLGIGSGRKGRVGKDVNVCNATDIIREFSDVFDGLGCYPGEHHIVVDTSVPPVIHAPCRVLHSLQPKLKEKLDSLVEAGMLMKQYQPTDWVFSQLRKEDGSLRLRFDPKYLSKAIKREHYVIPTLDDI